MRLYMTGSTQYVVDVIKNGFTTGRPVYDPGIDGSSRTSYMEYCEFRDRRPTGASMVVTPEAVFEDLAETNVFHVTIDGPVFLDDPGDFLLSMEVADDFALQCEVRPDPLIGSTFREFRLRPEEANRYLETLTIYDPKYGGEVRPDLVGK